MSNLRSIKEMVRKNIPFVFSMLSKLKHSVYRVLVAQQKKSLKEKIKRYHHGNPEFASLIAFLDRHPIQMIPYEYVNEYADSKILVKHDEKLKLKYVIYRGNEIYFPGHLSDAVIIESVHIAMVEQDARSPHKYLPANGIDIGGDVAILCGASDCIYALEIVNKFNKIFLFEANPDWVAPIRQTMRKYLDKIEIAPFYISDEDSSNSVTLDSFFRDKKLTVNYIQADIEGNELRMLKGASKLLQATTDLKIAICIYHTAEQEKEVTDFLKENRFNVQPSNGYVLLWMQVPLAPPYFRRAVLYAMR